MKNKKLVVFNYFLMHYHVARCKAVIEVGKSMGWDVKIYFGKPQKFTYPITDYSSFLNSKDIRSIYTKVDKVIAYKNRDVVKQTVNYLNVDKPDSVAILGYSTRMDWTALEWCRKNRKGAILMSESQTTDFKRSYWKELLKAKVVSLFDAALVGGKPHAAYISDLGMLPARIFTKYDVVDNDFWAEWAFRVQKERAYWRQSTGSLPKNFFLTACRLVPKKNVGGLIRAYARYVKDEKSPWPLVIAGDGPLRQELENFVESLDLAQNVRFLGYLSSEEMGPVYGLASAFILASAYSEQWGLVVNEAMAAGLPVLVSKICGCVPDLVIDGTTGFAFDPADEPALANLLSQCSTGKINLTQIGQAAQKHIQAYSPRTFGENLIASAESAIEHANKRRFNFWPFPV